MDRSAARSDSHMNGKFSDPHWTADGKPRAYVAFNGIKTLWFNTGTLCNIACEHCYIHSSPTNDALVYLSASEVGDYLEQVRERGWPTTEIGFTGGEPFMNPEAGEMIRFALERGFRVLVLTNAMRPMMRPRVQQALLAIGSDLRDRLVMRISLDHYSAELHDSERGKGSFEISLKGMRWLHEHGFQMHVAGRTRWGEKEAAAREGFARLFAENGFGIDAHDPVACMLFPEMDEKADAVEISQGCWNTLGKDPAKVMCASARMVVKRKNSASPTVVACTLLSNDLQFELGSRLADAEKTIHLNHPHCSTFCVLGGASCSA